MGAPESLIAAIDQVIEYFNKRRLDLPDGFFDRKTQFMINGLAFESLLSTSPNDPLVLMLARGAAGYRFTIKALQHAVPDAAVQRGDVVSDGDPLKVKTTVWIAGTLRGVGTPIKALVTLEMRLNTTGLLDVVEATVDEADLQKIRDARLRP